MDYILRYNFNGRLLTASKLVKVKPHYGNLEIKLTNQPPTSQTSLYKCNVTGI